MDPVDCIPGVKSLADNEDPAIRRFGQRFLYVRNFKLLIGDKPVHALSDHTKSFLNGFLKGTSDGHDLSDRFHTAPQFTGDTMEFTQIPTGYFADNVVQCRFEESGSRFGHRILQIEQSVTQA